MKARLLVLAVTLLTLASALSYMPSRAQAGNVVSPDPIRTYVVSPNPIRTY